MASAAKLHTRIKRYFIFFSIVGLLLLSLIVLLTVNLVRQHELVSKYELLEKIDNQACRYLDRQAGVNGGFDLEADSPQDKPRLTYWCLTGERVFARQVQDKFVDEYDFGARVLYFSSREEAEKHAQQSLSPLRNWGVDEEGQRNGMPQTSRFTFIVSDVEHPYFDAYTVKANAVLRVSLPCGTPEERYDLVACQAQADALLNRELKGINVL